MGIAERGTRNLEYKNCLPQISQMGADLRKRNWEFDAGVRAVCYNRDAASLDRLQVEPVWGISNCVKRCVGDFVTIQVGSSYLLWYTS